MPFIYWQYYILISEEELYRMMSCESIRDVPTILGNILKLLYIRCQFLKKIMHVV